MTYKSLTYVFGTHVWLRIIQSILVVFFFILNATGQEVPKGTINRELVVTRHNIKISNIKSDGPTQVGNGHFAYNFDITGMQTFNQSFTTMADWGWHSFPLPAGTSAADFKKTYVNTYGLMVPYDLPNESQKQLSDWIEGNPHKFNLGRIGFVIKKKDGTTAVITDLNNASQNVNLWSGVVESNFEVEGQKVKVVTVCGDKDIVGFKITSDLLKDGRLSVFIEFPYAAKGSLGNGSDYGSPQSHQTNTVIIGNHNVIFKRTVDSTKYSVACKWAGNTRLIREKLHQYTFSSKIGGTQAEYVFNFSSTSSDYSVPSFAALQLQSSARWPAFWKSGGAVDLSESKDQRWFELERRIVLSQYNMLINAGGNYPPGESGLVTNNWYNRFHYEMYWWHEAHYALWDRWSILNRSLHVYADNLKRSEDRAKSQGYEGARWPKCTGPNGAEWPHPIHAWLIWQQPHPIFFADLDYRAHPNKNTLLKWKDIVGETADFMASYAHYDSIRKQFVLGPPIYVVSENNDPQTTINPMFELAYWRFGLATAQKWYAKLNSPENPKWKFVKDNLSPLPIQDSLYVSWENIQNMWTKYNYEHPALTGAYGMLPGYGVDTGIMDKTFKKIQSVWRFNGMWGWDFGLLALSAARLGHPDAAVNILLDKSPKFAFDEHGYVGGGNPYPYFPSNGSLLYAVAMMTAGWDGDSGIKEPGWPKDGSWIIRWEGLKKAP